MISGVLKFAVDVAVLVLVFWAMARWRKPLWIRWAAGSTAYLTYVSALHTPIRRVILSSADALLLLAALPLLALRSDSSEEEMRAFAMSFAEIAARLSPMRLAWLEWALVPTVVLAGAHYTRRLVVARRERTRHVDRAGAPRGCPP